MSVYYNEHDPFAAAWLRELIKAGEIPDGRVDERDIQNVAAADLDGYAQCHFFAGIGGWALALKLAGWPADRPVWTGSCPCQPFSGVGKQKGGSDDRHVWPYWERLIRECRPTTVFGEQVTSAIAHGWLDGVFDDLEASDYACGAFDLPATCVTAPHIRHRLWFVAHSNREGLARCSTPLHPESIRPPWMRIATSIGDNSLGTGLVGQACLDQPMLYTGDDGLFNRVGRLRGYGNAIVPQVAAEVLRAYLEVAP